MSWLTPALAVGGRFPAERAEALALDHGIRAIVDLRCEECDDERVLQRCGLAFLHLPTEDQCAVSQPMLTAGVAFANRHLDREERVLIHCEHGIGRSATLALCVMVSRGMAPLEALALAKTRRPLVSPSPAQYETWIRWLKEWRTARGAGWDLPDFHSFRNIAYRHLLQGDGR